MSNFSVFPELWFGITRAGEDAESFIYDHPEIAVGLCRQNLESWVDWIYENEPGLEIPFDDSLYSLMTQPEFINITEPAVLSQMHAIRKLGNKAVHSSRKKSRIKREEALHILRLTYGLNSFFINRYESEYESYPAFDTDKIPPARKVQQNIATAKIKELTQKLLEKEELHKESPEKQKETEARRLAGREMIEIPIDPNEELTRKIYIDVLLEEAGWDLSDPHTIEYRVDRIPNKSNKGYADYVLWGKDGKPLAVVEAKRTGVDVNVGRHQAELYALALEQEFGQKPVVFLTNGYEIWLYDWISPLRRVHGYYTRDELQRFVDRRHNKKPISSIEINPDITDRYYQKAAIRAVGEHFEKNNRGALLVMATGTGKTRTAASMIDVLSKANWVKNVLFLADRDALVRQAKGAFNIHLPDYPAVDLRVEKESAGSRIVFSTYQTLINLIDETQNEEGRFYGVGHFDLIVFDEIHRSVYNKYKVIFDYFDGYKIGLTATPKESQIHDDTYDLFGLPHGNPTYSYDLDKAVADGFLVDYESFDVPTKFQREGIKYKDLSDAEKEEYEEKFGDPLTGEFPDEIDAEELDRWIYNKGTADAILETLMNYGLKSDNGEQLGKTILFTRKSDHAQFIRDRFNANYPQYSDQFLKVIDYRTNYADALLADFKVKDKMPVIACSVDMLDTGIDVPEVLNLVFLKPVKSPIKFWQMIGRGTRLCKDLLGPGEDKAKFRILDFCGNFEYFSENPNQQDAPRQLGLNERLFIIRLKLASLLIHQENEELKAFGSDLLETLKQQVIQLHAEGKDSFAVRRYLRDIEHFVQPEPWEDISQSDMRVLINVIAPLVYDNDKDSSAKLFDLLIYDLISDMLTGGKRINILKSKVIKAANGLKKKQSIPMVREKLDFIGEISREAYWESISVAAAERIRIEIRDLIKFLEMETRDIVITDFEDEVQEIRESPTIRERSYFDREAYERKVRQYVIENKHNITIDKLRKNLKITREELDSLENMLLDQSDPGNKEHFGELLAGRSLGAFIRSIVGLETTAAKEAFSSLINEANLNPAQIEFLDMIIDHFVQNGIVNIDELTEPPFTDIDSRGVIHLFGEKQAVRIREIIEGINANSEIG